jgi:hypothetical protein
MLIETITIASYMAVDYDRCSNLVKILSKKVIVWLTVTDIVTLQNSFQKN